MTIANQEPLFEKEEPTAPSPPATTRHRADLFNEHARKILGIANWRWFRLQAVDPDGILLTGAVCTAVYLSGKRKGRTNWTRRDRSTERTICITQRDHRAFCEEWEAATSLCSKCGGDGLAMTSWSATSGPKFRACPRCLGSGKAPGTKVEATP